MSDLSGKRVSAVTNDQPRDATTDGAAIREQLERMLVHPLFRLSKRYPHLFRTVVETTLQGNAELLKERYLGIQVFARDADYDTNADPIVRTTAGEIRKRIAQYYHEPGHENEIRIDLASGSYVPEFRKPPGKPAGETSPRPSPAAAAAPAVEVRTTKRLRTGYVAVLLAAAAILVAFLWRPWSAKPALERFWSPVLESSEPILLCVSPPKAGAANPGVPAALMDVRSQMYSEAQYVALADSITLARVAGLLQARGKSYRIKGQSATAFADLTAGPAVLIGGFNNDWTIRLTRQSRYSFAGDVEADLHWIQDRQNPSRKDWAVDLSMPYMKLTDDYAIISRVLDPSTDRMVVIAAGISNFGTLSAGEFLTDSRLMEDLAKRAPRGWERKNLQVVLTTKLINGSPGPPRMVDSYFW